MTCYAIDSTARSVQTACGKWIRHTADWTTAAARADCPQCLDSDAWLTREGRYGIGEPDVQVEADIAMRPENRELRNTMTRKQQRKAVLDGPVG